MLRATKKLRNGEYRTDDAGQRLTAEIQGRCTKQMVEKKRGRWSETQIEEALKGKRPAAAAMVKRSFDCQVLVWGRV